MTFKLSEEQIETFQRDGVIKLEKALSMDWINKIRAGIQANLDNPSERSERLALKEGQGHYFNDYCNWQDIPEFRDLVYNSCLGEIAAKLMRSPYAAFYHEHVLNKEPGTEKHTPWHHDQSYYPIDGWNMLSIWAPVDPVSIENTLRFISGSHRWGWFHPRKFASERNYPLEDDLVECQFQYQEVPVEDIEAGKFKIVEWDCDLGDVLVFHGKTLHGAGGNNSSSQHRRVLSTRWVGEGTVLATRPWQVSPPILGGLTPGDAFISSVFPVVYGTIN